MHALIVIDLQVDFCPGGALAVAGGDEIVGPVNAMMAEFDAVILTQDWHPAAHSSFAANHPGKAPYEMTEMPYGPQVLWPVHCVQGSAGAAFHPGLDTDRADLVIRKGSARHRQLFRLLRERPQHRHRARGLSAQPWHRHADHGRARAGFLRAVLGAGCGPAGL